MNFDCPICLQLYDSEKHLPKVMPCGHTICITCINSIDTGARYSFKCPLCKAPDESSLKSKLPTNFTIIPEDNNFTYKCRKHNSLTEFQCEDCKSPCCPECISEGCLNHSRIRSSELKMKVNSVVSALKKKLQIK